MLRTVYTRTAFQFAETDDVRITLDTDLVFVNERPHDKTTQWRRKEEGILVHHIELISCYFCRKNAIIVEKCVQTE